MVTTPHAPTEKTCNSFCIKRSTLHYLLLFLFIVFASPLFATTYYISSSTGDNSNNGTSPETAFETYRTLYYTVNLQPGDKVLFKRGDVFDEGLIVIKDSGTENNPIVFSSYGSGAKPILTANGPLEGWKNASNWSQVSGNVWKMDFPSHKPKRLWLDGSEVLQAMILKDVGVQSVIPHGPHEGEGDFQWWFYNDNILYLYATENPARSYHSIEGGLHRGALKTRSVSHIVIDGLNFRGGAEGTILFDTSSYITLKNSKVGYGYGGLGVTSNSPSSASHHIIIEDNLFDSGFNFYYGLSSEGTIGEVRGNQDGISFLKAVHHSIIRNNVFTGWGHTAILMGVTKVDYEGIHHNKIIHNTFTGSNNSYNRAFSMDGLEGKNYNNEIAYNLIKNLGTNQINGNNNWIHHNIFDGTFVSPAKKEGALGGVALMLSIYGSKLVNHDTKVDHNIFINTDNAAIRIHSYGENYEHVTGIKIRNNIFYNTGSNPTNSSDASVAIVLQAPQRTHNLIFKNNLFFNPKRSGADVIKYYKENISVAEFNKSNGSHGNIIENNRYADPLFVDYENANYHLKENSPAIDTGVLIDALKGAEDRDGNEIYYGASPDIGVYEYVASTMEIPTHSTTEQQIAVYPNPFQSSFTVEGEQLGKKKIRVYNILGKLVFSTTVEGKKSRINLVGKSSGIYLVKIISDKGITSTKLIKK